MALKNPPSDMNAVLDQVPDLVAVVGIEGRLESVNSAWERTLGYAKSELEARFLADFVHPDDRSRVEAALRDLASRDSVLAFQVRHVCKDGSIRIIAWNAAPPCGESIHATGRDVSEAPHDTEPIGLTLSALSLGAWDWNVESGSVQFSDFWLARLGYGRGDLPPTVEGWKSIVHPEDLPEALMAVAEHFEARTEIYEHRHRIRSKSGEYRWNLDRGRVVEWADDGSPVRMVGTDTDLTDEMAAEAELALSERRYRTLLEVSPLAVFETDALGVPTYVNQAWCDMAGIEKEKAFSHGWADSIHPEDREKLYADWMACVEAKEPYLGEYRFLTPSGHVTWVYGHAAPMLNEDGGLIGYLGTNLDITQRRVDEEERRKLDAEVQQAQKLESLAVLAGGVAHDFNNLLTGVLGNADLALLDLPDGSPVREHVERVISAAHRAAELAQQMLAYSGRGKAVVEVVDLSVLVSQVAQILEVSIAKRARLELDLPEGLPPVSVDPTQLRQVIMNLVTNASEAMNECGGVLRISTGVVQCDPSQWDPAFNTEPLPCRSCTFVEVSDSGHGMDPETRERIFEPFFSTKFTGRGLGLASALGIVRGHGGAITVETAEGEGTRLRVVLPAVEGVVDTAGLQPPAVQSSDGQRTILIVDDEAVVSDIARKMLERGGYRVVTTEDGSEALAVFAERHEEIDAVLLDLTMPGISGDEVFGEIKKIRDVPVVLSSGFYMGELEQRFRDKSFSGFVQKPYKFQVLIGIMREALGDGTGDADDKVPAR